MIIWKILNHHSRTMDALTARLVKDFEQMKQEIRTEKAIEVWPLMDPYLIGTIIVGYLFFVLKLGPDIMKGREPFDLKIPMIVYNAFQVAYNLRMCLALFLVPNAISYLYENACSVKSENPALNMTHPLYYAMCEFGWYYLVSKVIDLIDTVFFVLRKKQSHVTFLHVYHHASLVFLAWAYIMYIRGTQGILIGFLNSFVHTLMYFYYLLAAFGDAMKPFLTWKSYVTILQLAQFAIIITYLGSLLAYDCSVPKVYSYYVLANGILFFKLFLDFYQKTYSREETPKAVRKEKPVVKKPVEESQKQVAAGSEFWKVFTNGMTFMCFPGLQDELYNDDEDKTE